jgi:hypothetical protein
MIRSLYALRDSESIDGWHTHRLYGFTLASDFSFAANLAPSLRRPDLTFSCVSSGPPFDGWERAEPVYASLPYRVGNGESEVLVYRTGDCLIVRFTGISDFYLWPDRILCHLRPSEYRQLLSGRSEEEVQKNHHMLAEIYFLGYVFACWLEWRGVPALHASAVVVGERAVAFLSNSGGGKSSSAVTLMQAGYPLLTDDILPVEYSGGEYLGYPGYPQMRLWPEQAQHFLGRYEDLDLVHPSVSKRRVPVEGSSLGAFCDIAQPLACLYLPERRNPRDWGTRIEIEPVSRRDAVMALIGHSFTPFIVEALGLHPQRLRFFAQMALQVPVRRIHYPSGFDHLMRVREAILEDLKKTLPQRGHSR